MKYDACKKLMASLAVAMAALSVSLLLSGSPLTAVGGPDMIVDSIVVDPSIPDPGQMFTLTVVTKNQGDASTGGSSFWDYVYLDPVDRPPTQSTTYTYRYGAGPLGPGVSSPSTRSNDPKLSFPTAGCDHVIYAWADKTNLVSETIETNNILSQTVCVGVTCQADAYEPDNTCESSRWLTNTMGTAQHHTLCPIGDEDWVKFATVAGITYTLEAKNPGMHADPLLYLYNGCNGVAQFGEGPRIVWRSPASSVAYVRVVHRQPTYGPLTDYDLALTVDNSGVYDIYEPDNTCASARDLPTDGTRQTHYFQVISDTDWVKFPVESGQTAIVVADNTGPGVSPQVSVYNSCEQSFGQPLAQGPQAQLNSGGGGMFYAEVVNQNAGVYGQMAFYDLSMNVTGCTADDSEGDDTAAAAKLVPTTGVTRTHNICPAGDQDWVKFNAMLGITYTLETLNLGPAADTELFLYGPDGTTQLAYNDDYTNTTGLLNSRIAWRAPMTGTFYAKIQHVKPNVAGPNTRYDFSISEGACTPDAYDSGKGDNGPLDASPLSMDGTPQRRNFCPVGDQDWASFTASAGMTVTVRTSALAPGADTVLGLLGPDATTIITSNDDFGAGVQSLASFIAPEAGTYYARVIPFNTNQFGDNTAYQLSATGSAPPAPTTAPTPWPTPTPTPPMTTTASIRTLILVNRERIETLYSANAASQLMNKLYELSSHPRVKGLVIQVESSPSVAAAYSQWTADEASLLNTDKANDVASAVRNLALTYLDSGPDIKHIVIVGDDRVIPFRRIEDQTNHQTVKETVYATTVTTNTTQWAALRDNMTLTDNYYADKVPTTRADWDKGEIYLPDYGIGRLIETPDEIMAFINTFLASDGTVANRGLVTGYDFVEDTAGVIDSLLAADSIPKDNSLVGSPWTAGDLSNKQLASGPRFDVQSINGHANHEAEIAPDNSQLTAAEIATSTTDLSGAIIFTVGCHSGFNDSGALSLAQAFAQKKANYVANTGYGWGGGGTTYSEALMRDYAVELLSGSSTEMGDALRQAKLLYYDQLATFNGYDYKVLAEATFYGLPMTVITTGATFGGEAGFPSMTTTPTLPTGSLGQLNTGHMSCGLAGSFGAFGEVTNTQSFFSEGTFYALDNTIHASAGEPVQPKFFADLSAPSAGNLRGALFLGGVYSDVAHFHPVIVQPFNEYVTSTTEPAFASPGWYPPVPVSIHDQATISGSKGMLVTLLGQFDSSTSSERLYDHMAFDTYYSSDPDIQPPSITYVDGVLNETTGRGSIKVEANDASGVVRVLAVFTGGNGLWQSQDLAYDAATFKWKGEITATLQTRYLIQAVDGAGNVGTAHNKGRYYSLLPPAPLIQGGMLNKIYLPIILKIGG